MSGHQERELPLGCCALAATPEEHLAENKANRGASQTESGTESSDEISGDPWFSTTHTEKSLFLNPF